MKNHFLTIPVANRVAVPGGSAAKQKQKWVEWVLEDSEKVWNMGVIWSQIGSKVHITRKADVIKNSPGPLAALPGRPLLEGGLAALEMEETWSKLQEM